MHSEGFEVLNKYLEASSLIADYSMAVCADQKVPQNSFTLRSEMFPNTTCEGQFTYTPEEFLTSMGEFAPTNQTVIPVIDTQQDPRPFRTESPKCFMDLDNVHTENQDSEVSFYDPNLNIKEEKVYSACSVQQPPANLPNFCHIENDNCDEVNVVQMKIEPYEQTFCDQSYEHCDFGSAVVFALKKEINHVCRILEIAPEPLKWSENDVRKWIMWHGNQFNASYDITEAFRMSGEQLCLMTSDDFKRRSPDAGLNLYSQLDVWKNACSLPSPPNKQTTSDYSYYHVPTTATIFAPQSRSPTPSTTSEDSSTISPLNSPLSTHSDEEIPSYPTKPHTDSHHKQTIHLWEFLKELLLQPENYSGCIKWVSRPEGIFKIEDSSRVARLWGKRKNRPAMNYDKLSRSIRQYYKKGIIKKTEHSKRLVYQFCQPYL